LPPVTPLPSASHMRSLHSEASAYDRLRPFAPAPCLTLTGTNGAMPCSRRDAHASTFLPPFPQSGFAPRSFSESLRIGTMKALTAARLTRRAPLPAYLATPSCRSISNHVGCLDTASPTTPACPAFFGLRPGIAGSSQLPAVSSSFAYGPTVRLRLLSTSPRGQRSYLRLRSCGILRHGLSPC
jgi:hypothetical protein